MLQNNKKEIGELHPKEIDLILMIRHVYKFGELNIITRDGMPEAVIKTVLRTNLGGLSTQAIDKLKEQFTIINR